jgi:hypothetical protein
MWGISTSTILPYGSNDVGCPGLQSTSQTMAQIIQEQQDGTASLAHGQVTSNHIAVSLSIAAVVTAVYALSVGLWWFFRRRFQRRQGLWGAKQDYRPRVWQFRRNTASYSRQDDIIVQSSLTSKITRQPTYRSLEDSHLDAPVSTILLDWEHPQSQAGSSMDGEASGSLPPTPPIQMTFQERKMLGIHENAGASVSRGASASSSSSRSTSRPYVDDNLNSNVEADIIIQHRDAGAGIVLELPPPYADCPTVAPIASTPAHFFAHDFDVPPS